ncbi:MAG: signal peptidase I [Lachnospiraceae bacterium]|nr:signal peptidase I [Lachnospiraceae bacterium]
MAGYGGFGLGPYYQNERNGQEKKFLKVIGWGVDLVAVITLAFFAVVMFGGKITVSGRSMEPLLTSGDVVLLDKLWYNFSGPNRMDVIAFKDAEEESRIYIKRIIGLPGEQVQIKDGFLYIDGQLLENPVNPEPIKTAGLAEIEIQLGDSEYFVLGDNSDTSEDSRFSNVGNVHISQVQGRVWFRISPSSQIGFIK